MLTFQVIATFENYEQDIFEFDLINKDNIDENSFIIEVFRCIEHHDDLTKLSICQFSKNNNFIDWLIKRNGKYYFNTDINEDDDTKYWNDFRNKYIKKQV